MGACSGSVDRGSSGLDSVKGCGETVQQCAVDKTRVGQIRHARFSKGERAIHSLAIEVEGTLGVDGACAGGREDEVVVILLSTVESLEAPVRREDERAYMSMFCARLSSASEAAITSRIIKFILSLDFSKNNFSILYLSD